MKYVKGQVPEEIHTQLRVRAAEEDCRIEDVVSDIIVTAMSEGESDGDE